MGVGVQCSYKRNPVVHNDGDDGRIGGLEGLLLLSTVTVAKYSSEFHDVRYTQTGGDHVGIVDVAAVVPDLGRVDKLGHGGGDGVAGAGEG